VLTIIAFTPIAAQADFIFTASGTGKQGDGPLNAEAYFAVGNGTITLYVANLLPSTADQGQGISGVQFSVSGLSGNMSLSSVSGDLVTLNSVGTFSSPTYSTFTPSSNPANADWGFTSTTNPGLLTDIGNSSTSNPHYMILGPNAQFAGGGGTNFNPYFQSQATKEFTSAPTQGAAIEFILNAPGVTSNSTISGVTFEFGTGPDTKLPGVLAVPAPSSVVLLGIGLAFILARWRMVRMWRRTRVCA
jgi:hypothetical protein